MPLVRAVITDHGDLTGLGNDDHTQYHNNTRGDARYYTQSQVDALLATKASYINVDGGSAFFGGGTYLMIDGGGA